jgi:hypothetical protein
MWPFSPTYTEITSESPEKEVRAHPPPLCCYLTVLPGFWALLEKFDISFGKIIDRSSGISDWKTGKQPTPNIVWMNAGSEVIPPLIGRSDRMCFCLRRGERHLYALVVLCD